MKRAFALLATALLTMPSAAIAAPKTCNDFLVRQPTRTYNCTAPDANFQLTFAPDASALVPQRFKTTTSPSGFFFFGNARCVCDAASKTQQNPRAYESPTNFTCIQANNSPDPFGFVAYSLRGHIGGKDGSKISIRTAVLRSDDDMIELFGSCTLTP